MQAHDWLYTFNLLGTFVFAVSGALAASKKKMDAFGMLVLAIATGTGGGALRSIFIGDYPLPFLKDANYLIVALAATLLVFYGRSYFRKHEQALLIFDAFGLAVFLSTGITVALDQHLSLWASVLLGIITATFGGVIRDVLSAEVPLIFRRELYATAALAGGLVYVILYHFKAVQPFTIIAASLVTFAVRELAIKYDLSLPR